MYHCGPTVYHYAHIGNLRAYVFADILRRTLEYKGFMVDQVINITDVGHLTGDSDVGKDKVEEEAKKEHKTAVEISAFYTAAFFEDLKKLNIETARTKFPKATEHITGQIDLIKKLEEKGFTYTTSDGIYFDTSKFKDYGKLGNIDLKGLEEGARVAANTEKKNLTDFALWKFSKPGEKRQQEWESPWGVGFPGWHIECSAMSMKYLGETFDIHTGGIDHIPVHHNNEIAQSESATGREFVRFWLHSAFVNITGEKMAKSEGNFLRLQTLIEHGIYPLAYRYWLLTSHYRSPINFTLEAVESAHIALEKIVHEIAELLKTTQREGAIIEEYKNKLESFIDDDLGTPEVIALLHKLLKDTSIEPHNKLATIFEFDKVLGLNLKTLALKMSEPIPTSIETLKTEIETHRKNKEWEKSDAVRKEIESQGYKVHDLKDETVVERTLTSLI